MLSTRLWRAITLTAATATVATVGVGMSVVSASGADTYTSETHARSQFLAGTLGAIPLVATADNVGGEATVRKQEALLGTSGNKLLQLGVANQVAVADTGGVAQAMTGAVDNGSGVAPADLSLSLDSVLGGTPLSGVLENLTVKLGALSSAAAVDATRTDAPASTCADPSRPVHCRDYEIAGGSLNFKAPVVGSLVDQILDTLTVVTDEVNKLTGPNGLLANAIKGLSDVAGLTGLASLDINATVQLDLAQKVREALADPVGDDIVKIDLSTGQITADLDKLVIAATGHSLNDQAPNTEVLSKAVIDELTSHLVDLLAALPGKVLTVVENVVDGAAVNVSVNACLLGTGIAPDCTITVAGVPLPTGAVGLAVNIDGTIKELLGAGGTTSVQVQLGPITTSVPAGDVLSAVRPLLRTLTDTVATDLGPALNGVVATATSALEPALDALPQLLSLVVNVQEDSTVAGLPGYAQSALRLSAADVLDVELARSEVSARLTPVNVPDPEPTVDPEPTAEPEPTVDPEPTVEPEPTVDSEPTVDPEPTVVPEPTVDPEPTRPAPAVPTKFTAGI